MTQHKTARVLQKKARGLNEQSNSTLHWIRIDWCAIPCQWAVQCRHNKCLTLHLNTTSLHLNIGVILFTIEMSIAMKAGLRGSESWSRGNLWSLQLWTPQDVETTLVTNRLQYSMKLQSRKKAWCNTLIEIQSLKHDVNCLARVLVSLH